MKKVLVIDDDERVSKTVACFLDVCGGYRVSTAANGVQGIVAAGKGQPDMILLDINMPDMSGLEVLKRLKEAPDTGHIPVIMLTGVDSKDAIEKAMYDYAEHYIVKPFELPALQTKIERSLSLRASHSAGA